MGKNTLAHTTKCITIDFEDLKRKWITNKTKCGVGIIRMEQAMVLIEQRMERIRHRDAKFYYKYNQDDKCMVDRVIQHIITFECINGRPLIYQEAYDDEMVKYCVILLNIFSTCFVK